ncbi:MAG: hypothetical protein RSG96_05785, partial [Clostridia bacterium]
MKPIKEERHCCANRSSLNKLPTLFILFCMLPSCLLVISFYIIPTMRSISLSFQKVSALTLKGTWIGMENYQYLFKDASFQKALFNTIKLLLVVPICTITTSFILAFILQQVKLAEKQMYVT